MGKCVNGDRINILKKSKENFEETQEILFRANCYEISV